ncbi:MAG: hypothetical protein HYW25_00880 [Candidatus Aenigmarchaeota archaeon]|nr:hypothetical protein [Candidatus Aenigmarchaeota archaeon]
MILRYCSKCKDYCISFVCPRCGLSTRSAHPTKFRMKV